jgi:hypothetical protein
LTAKRSTQTLQQHSREAVLSREVARAATVIPPFLVWFGILPAGVIIHAVWPSGRWWVVAVVLLITTVLALEARHLARNRITTMSRYLAMATTVLIGLWMAWAGYAGFSWPETYRSGTFRSWLFGFALAVFWAVWLHIHDNDDEAGGGGIRRLIGEASEHTAVPNLKASVRDDTVPGRLRLNVLGDVGTTGGDIIKAGEQINAAVSQRVRGGIPPGSIKLTQHPDMAHAAIATVTDPRILDTPRLWPGPSLPGSTIADPVTVGFWADGMPLAFRVINHHLLLMGCTGAGKALDVETRIPTPSGWEAMGELEAGDFVFGEDGRPARVTDAWPVMVGRPCYRVRFSDGAELVADADHLWLADTWGSRNRGARPEVRPTIKLEGCSVRVASPLELPDADLPVPPYTLGAWLGDGVTITGVVGSADREVIAEIESEGMQAVPIPSGARGRCQMYRIVGLSRALTRAGLRYRREVPVGHTTMTGTKRIPVVYQRASEEQRRALLAGLLDSDGHCAKNGAIDYTSTSEELARDVLHLVSGLGYKAALRSKPARYRGKHCGTAWRVVFATSDKVFRLPRKLARQNTVTRATAGHRYVVAVEPVASRPVRCIAVDSPSRLYLAGESCVPTHNSFGYGASEIGETISRSDAAIIGIDFAKGGQVLGPWRNAMHHLATELADGRNILWGACQSIAPRLEHLGSLGLADWEPGCGLTHVTIWIEEASKFFKELPSSDVEGWLIPGILAMRAAGIRIVFSIQRADFSNMPTTVRSQLASGCMGLLDSKDAAFGLSEYQSQHDCNPALWGSEYPGKIYMDCPGVSHEHKIMEGRTWSWGGRTAPQTAAAYAVRFPASERPLDLITASCVFPAPATTRQAARPQPQPQPAAQPAPGAATATVISREDRVHPNHSNHQGPAQAPPPEAFDEAPDPTPYDSADYSRQEGDDQPIEHPPGEGFEFAAPPQQNVARLKYTPEQAAQHLAQCIAAWWDHGVRAFDMALMVDVLEVNQLSRTWPYSALSAFVSSGHLEQLDNPRRWRILHRPDVDVPASADIPYPDPEEAVG